MTIDKAKLDEVWMPVKGYEGLYEASNVGRVRNFITSKVLKDCAQSHGYRQVSIRKDMKSKTFRIHQLVLKAFSDEKFHHLHVNHIDDDKTGLVR